MSYEVCEMDEDFLQECKGCGEEFETLEDGVCDQCYYEAEQEAEEIRRSDRDAYCWSQRRS